MSGRRIKKKKISPLSWLLPLAAAVILAAVLIFTGGGEKEPPEEPVVTTTTPGVTTTAPAASTTTTTAAAATTQPVPDEPGLTDISAVPVTRGDLILVNRENPYSFEEEEAELVGVIENRTVKYLVKDKYVTVSGTIMERLDTMISECRTATGDTEVGVVNGHRTYQFQDELMQRYIKDRGEEYAKTYVAEPGCSEHHTGLAVDLGAYYEDGSSGVFKKTLGAPWITENCWRYGFILRYTEEKEAITGIGAEEWHFRYVGLPHAWYIMENGLCYEEYIALLLEGSLEFDLEGKHYTVFRTEESAVAIPEGAEYTVSGDNLGGRIVTVTE